MLRWLAVVVLTVKIVAGQRLFLEKNLALPVSAITLKELLVSRVDILLAIDKSNLLKGQYQMMTVDITSSLLLVTNKSADQVYGLQCDDDSKCEQANTTETVKYGQMSLQCSNASTLLRFQEINLPAGFKTSGVPFKLCNATEEWKKVAGEGGVLGLDTGSKFWKYIVEQYRMPDDNKILVGLSYKVRNEDTMLPDKSAELVNSFLIINGQYSTAKAVMQPYTKHTFNNLWTVKGIGVDLTESDTYSNTTVCVDNTVGYFIMMKPFTYSRVMADFNYQLCGKYDGCYFSNSNLPNVKSFKITVTHPDDKNEFSVRLTADDLVKFDKSGKPIYGFGDMSQSACSMDKHQFALGRWFLMRAEFLIEVDDQLNFKVGFAPLFGDNKSRAVLIIVLISLLSMFLLGILVIIAVNFLPRCCKQKDDYTLTDAKADDN